MTAAEPLTSNQLAQERTDLATQRNLMAADRTLMAWVRTSLSLQAFGFTIYKVLQELQRAGIALPREHTPRNVGLFLIALGTLAIVMGTVEYWQTLKDLRHIGPVSFARSAMIIAVLMSMAGIVLFVGVISRLM